MDSHHRGDCFVNHSFLVAVEGTVKTALLCFGSTLQFGQPWLLVFLAAVLVPILIHIWSRNRRPELPWAATQLMQRALERVSRRISLQQWLVLLIRVGLLIFLSLALASPLIIDGEQHGEANLRTTVHVLIIDRSYSMRAGEGEANRLNQARLIATNLVDRAREGDGFLFSGFSRELETIIAIPTSERERVINEIAQFETGEDRLDVSRLSAGLDELIQTPALKNFDQVVVHFVSDFCDVDWEPPARDQIAQIQSRSDLKLVLYQVARSSPRNRWIQSIVADKSQYQLNERAQIQIEVASDEIKQGPGQRVALELKLNGNVVGSRTIDFSNQNIVTEVFNVPMGTTGANQLIAEIEPDSLMLDNRRHLICSVVERPRILIVEGKPGAAKFIELALKTSGAIASSDSIGGNSVTPFELTTTSSGNLSEFELKRFDCIIIDNPNPIERSETLRLRHFMASGKTVVLFLGDRVDRNAFNTHWNDPVADTPGFNLALGVVAPFRDYRIDPLEYASPLISDFRGNEDAGLLQLPIWSYVKTQINDPESTRVDLAFENGDALMLTVELGSGRCILFTSSSSSLSRDRSDPKRAWNALEIWPSYVPLIGSIVNSAIQPGAATEYQIGDIAAGQFEFFSPIRDATLLQASATRNRLIFGQADGQVRWQSEPFREAGFVQLEFAAADNRVASLTLAVNSPVEESNLQMLSVSDSLLQSNLETASPESGSRSNGPLNSFQWILLILAGLLLTDSILSRITGRPR